MRLPRFSIRIALVIVGALAVAMSTLTKQQRIAAKLRRHDVQITYEYQYDNWADLERYSFNDRAELSAIERFFGADLCSRIVSVSSNHAENPAEIARLAFQLPHLRRLAVKRTSLVDGDLNGLSKLHELRKLELHGTEISDASVEMLSRLTKLRTLGLIDTKLSGEAVQALRTALPRTRITTEPDGHM